MTRYEAAVYAIDALEFRLKILQAAARCKVSNIQAVPVLKDDRYFVTISYELTLDVLTNVKPERY